MMTPLHYRRSVTNFAYIPPFQVYLAIGSFGLFHHCTFDSDLFLSFDIPIVVKLFSDNDNPTKVRTSPCRAPLEINLFIFVMFRFLRPSTRSLKFRSNALNRFADIHYSWLAADRVEIHFVQTERLWTIRKDQCWCFYSWRAVYGEHRFWKRLEGLCAEQFLIWIHPCLNC